MRFNAEAYEKVFPPKQEGEKIESVVETFKPTEEALKQPEEAEEKVEKMVEDVEQEGDIEDGDRQPDNPDSE